MKVDTTKIMSNMTATVPKSIREALKLKPGDHLEWHITDQQVVVKKKENRE